MELFGNGTLDIQFNFGDFVSVGSIEGDGFIELGTTNTLITGANNLSTTFSGVIEEPGSLAKIGTGTLTLSGNNTYASGTSVTGGVLKVANTTGSATGTGPVNVDAGTLSGNGIIGGAVVLGTGAGAGAVIAPSGQTDSQPGTLTINGNLTFNSDSTYSYSYEAKSNRARTGLVVANGVTINGDATLDFNGTIHGRLTPGLTFTVISNTSATPISGTFSNLFDGSTVVLAGNTFQVSYEGGDGNDLTLTVVP